MSFFRRKPLNLSPKRSFVISAGFMKTPMSAIRLPQVYLEEPKRLGCRWCQTFLFYQVYACRGFELHPIRIRGSKKRGARLWRDDSGSWASRSVPIRVPINLLFIVPDDAECDQVLAYLEKTDVPPIQIHIDCLILERFGDVTKDWETTLLIENFLGQEITLGESKYPGPAFPGGGSA